MKIGDKMETITIILFVAIAIFALGNILLFFLDKKTKKRLPLNNANAEVLNSKIDVLNKRINTLEQQKIIEKPRIEIQEIKIDKPETKIEQKTKIETQEINTEKIVCKNTGKEKKKTLYPITLYKKKK